MVGGIFCQFCSPWIDHDGGLAAHGELLQLGTGYGVTIGGVGTDHHDGIGVLQVDDAVGGSTCTKRTLHTECSRRVAYPGTTVDVVGADDRTNEFLHQVILFIRTTGRRDTGDAVGSVFFFDGGQLLCNEVKGFFPGGFHQFSVLTNERCADTILMVVETEGIASFQTGMSAVHFCIVRCLDTLDLSVNGRYFQVTSHSAIGTHSAGHFCSHHTLAFEHIADGAGGAGLCTGTAAHAVTFKEADITAFDDVVVKSATGHAQYELSLYFIAGTHTAIAVDALAEIGGHVRMRQVFLSVQVGLAFRVTHLSDAHLRGHILELAVAVHLAGETVQRVICQHQFNDVLPQLLHILRRR